MKKSFTDIYKRNFKGTFYSGFIDPSDDYFPSYALPIVIAITHIALLPLSLTFGALIKSLIDFFSRKEITDAKLNNVESEINKLNDTELLVKTICEYPRAKSTSSQQLIESLQQISRETDKTIQEESRKKKLELQKEQLKEQFNVGQDTELTNIFQLDCINNLQLNEEKTALFEQHVNELKEYCKSKQIKDEKSAIVEYVKAEHNTGKRMQHNICNFFESATTTEAGDCKISLTSS